MPTASNTGHSRLPGPKAGQPEKVGSMKDIILEVHGVTKDFPGVRALDDMRFTLRRGEERRGQKHADEHPVRRLRA